MKIKRTLKSAKDTFFLFGPRATGKTTWLKEQVKPDFFIDLLKSKEYLRFSKHPEILSELIDANPNWKSVVIDEIQKIPNLLDEIHSIIFEKENKLQFILTGSSARKLKQKDVNLLAGRALIRRMHPFTAHEIDNKFNIEIALKYGMLPNVWNLEGEEDKKDYLFSYVETYLKEEIQQEALTRNLPAYSAFLEHMALRNSHVINLQSLSQQIGIARTTIKGYLEILEDTLLGYSLRPVRLKAKVKEVSTPKFYFFDSGVVRTLSHSLDESLGCDEKGSLLETYVLHELMSFSDYQTKRWQFYYWGTPTESEVDFVVSSGRTSIGIEVKSSKEWNKNFSHGLNILLDSQKIKKAYGVYMGEELIKKDRILIIPAKQFSKYLFENNLFA